MNSVRVIAKVFPQFHPIPINDKLWGKGFTEWTNVTRAKPLFPGHYQPRLPADLGFYDLRLPEARQAQADLARQHGIYGFCYDHYWFGGKRLMERPFDEVLQSGQPDFPFCLHWANEAWTRRWDGWNDKDVLVEQPYGGESDDRNHFCWLLKAFADPRYIRIDGKPLFFVYRAPDLPDPKRTMEVWREEAARAGLPGLYLASAESRWATNWDPTSYGFDAAVEFQPAFALMPWGLSDWLRSTLLTFPRRPLRPPDRVYSYHSFVEHMMHRQYPAHKMFRGVCPGWDNSPRRKSGAMIMYGANPNDFGRWLRQQIRWTEANMKGDERIVFISAWNEWAEGNYLEPDQKWGTAFLEQVADAIH